MATGFPSPSVIEMFGTRVAHAGLAGDCAAIVCKPEYGSAAKPPWGVVSSVGSNPLTTTMRAAGKDAPGCPLTWPRPKDGIVTMTWQACGTGGHSCGSG